MSHCFPLPSLLQWDAFICLFNTAPSGEQLIGTVRCLGTVSFVLCHMLKADPLHRWRRCQVKALWDYFSQWPSRALSSSILFASPRPICIGRGCEKSWILTTAPFMDTFTICLIHVTSLVLSLSRWYVSQLTWFCSGYSTSSSVVEPALLSALTLPQCPSFFCVRVLQLYAVPPAKTFIPLPIFTFSHSSLCTLLVTPHVGHTAQLHRLPATAEV